VNVAIAISSDVYNRIGGVGNVGGIVGSAVSGSFLFIIGLANTIILYRILSKRRALKRHVETEGGPLPPSSHETSGLMMRFIGPITTFVNRPWKMYPVGVLFGFGFDTASSIALLAVTALAKKGTDGSSIGQGDIVVLPFLFTAGMTIVDSADSILMLYSYAGLPKESRWALIKRRILVETVNHDQENKLDAGPNPSDIGDKKTFPDELSVSSGLPNKREADPSMNVDIEPVSNHGVYTGTPGAVKEDIDRRSNATKLHTMSNLSIALTVISILVAFSISIITIMGLIGQSCAQCQEAAERKGGGGLAGSWWRGWAKANDNSGFIGAGIVGGFVVLVVGWSIILWAIKQWKRRSTSLNIEEHDETAEIPHNNIHC